MRTGFALAAALLAAPHARAAAPTFDLGGSVRLRYESLAGQIRPGFNRNDDLRSLRTTLHAAVTLDHWHAVGEIYDSRVDGGNAATPITTSEVNALELVQAYVGRTMPGLLGAGSEVTLDAGRIMLNIASRRLVAADDYRNTTNSYTGVRATFAARGGWAGTLIYVLPQRRLPDDPQGLRDHEIRWDREDFDLVLWGGTVARAKALGSLTAEASFYHLGERDAPGRPTRNRSLDTYGGRLFRDPHPGQADVEVEALLQSGSIRASTAADAAPLDVRAWFVHADVGYTFAAPWQPRLSLDYDQASGDGSGPRYGRFDTLFGMRRADFAPSGIFATTGRANILSPGVRLEATPGRRADWFVSYRPMWLDARADSFSTSGVRDPAGASGRFAGHQLDARLRYWVLLQRLRFEFDGVLFASGHFLRSAPNGPAAHHTRYLSFNMVASF